MPVDVGADRGQGPLSRIMPKPLSSRPEGAAETTRPGGDDVRPASGLFRP